MKKYILASLIAVITVGVSIPTHPVLVYDAAMDPDENSSVGDSSDSDSVASLSSLGSGDSDNDGFNSSDEDSE